MELSTPIDYSGITFQTETYRARNHHVKKTRYKVNPWGKIVGTHDGAQFVTVGQRKGLNIGGHKEPIFVLATDIPNNVIYVGEGHTHKGLMRSCLRIAPEEIHWIRPDLRMEEGENRRYLVRIRYRQPLQQATLLMRSNGLFILFTQDKKYLESSRKTSDETDNTSPVQFLDYTSYIHDYDTYLLCMTILSQKGLSMQQQQYLSEIAIALAGESTQLAGELADRGEALAEHTLPVFQETLQTLKLPVERIDQRVQYALWQAQLKVFFPLLEQFRRQLFETYRTDITERFHAAPSGTYDCERPEELEIGQLLFLFKQTRILSMRDYELLQSAKEARNCLAHLNHLSYPKLKVWLSMNFRQQN